MNAVAVSVRNGNPSCRVSGSFDHRGRSMTFSATAPEVVVDRQVTVIGLGPAYKSIDEKSLEGGLRSLLLEAVDRANPPRIVVDLSHTKFFGSSFIELLFQLWNCIQSKPSGAFVLCGVTEYCEEVLKVSHLHTLWRQYPTRNAAVEALTTANG